MLGEPAGETMRTAVELKEYPDAEHNAASEPESYRMDKISQNNRDARTSISQPPSQLSSRRSSFHVDEPMSLDVRSNADSELRAALLMNRASDSEV